MGLMESLQEDFPYTADKLKSLKCSGASENSETACRGFHAKSAEITQIRHFMKLWLFKELNNE